MQLDPRQKHVRYELGSVRDIARIWNELDKLQAVPAKRSEDVFVLTADARKLDDALASLPPELRAQAKLYATFLDQARDSTTTLQPRTFVLTHTMMNYVIRLMGVGQDY